MNRFKLISVLVVLTVVGILLGQNRQLLALKFFCPDVNNQSCLYRTPELPLAAWIGFFAIAGIFSSLVWQFLNQLATPSQNPSPNRKSRQSNNYRSVDTPIPNRQSDYTSNKIPNTVKTSIPDSDWEQPINEDWEADDLRNKIRNEPQKSSISDRDRKEPQDRARSDSAYSYKFREVDGRKSEQKSENSQKSTIDDVYDASYRTLNSPQQTESKSYDDEDDEEWI